jgi:hypothetical protein
MTVTTAAIVACVLTALLPCCALLFVIVREKKLKKGANNVVNEEESEDSSDGRRSSGNLTEAPRPPMMQELRAIEVDIRTLVERVALSARGEENKDFRSTVEYCLKLLADDIGGAIIAVMDGSVTQDVPFEYLDEGAFTEILRREVGNIIERKENFASCLAAFCQHTESDRWELPILQQLAPQLGYESPDGVLLSLNAQPKDGALILSPKGTVLAASVQLKVVPKVWQLKKHDGARVGTRHAAALATAEILAMTGSLGAVLVRSDAGGVHVMLPGPGGELQAYYIPHGCSNGSESQLNFAAKLQLSSPRLVRSNTWAGLEAISFETIRDDVCNGMTHDLIIGKGAFSIVYGGRWKEQDVAVKVCNGSPEMRAAVWNEVNMLRFCKHRLLVEILAVSCDEHHACLIMPLMPRGSLAGLFENAASLKLVGGAERTSYMRDVFEALAYLHSPSEISGKPSIVHRDIKPENILLDGDIACLSDFGVGRIMGDVGVKTCVVGTPGYEDPEYISTRILTRSSDVYSAGVVAMELLSGRRGAFERLEQIKVKPCPHFVDKSVTWPDSTEMLHQAVIACTGTRDQRPGAAEVHRMLKPAEDV